MANASQVAEQAAAWRESANRARRLAGTFHDGPDRDRLLQYAEELEEKAARLAPRGALDDHAQAPEKPADTRGYPRAAASGGAADVDVGLRIDRAEDKGLGSTRSSERDAREIARVGVSNERKASPPLTPGTEVGSAIHPSHLVVSPHAAAIRAAFMRTTGSDRPAVTALKRSWRRPSAT
jgi:hypothetical protein